MTSNGKAGDAPVAPTIGEMEQINEKLLKMLDADGGLDEIVIHGTPKGAVRFTRAQVLSMRDAVKAKAREVS
jgi:hypothetical protein